MVAVDSDSIQVNWQLNSSNPNRFPATVYSTEVYRAPGTNPLPADWLRVSTATGGAVTYLNSGLEPYTPYSYKLRFSVPDSGTTRYSIYSESVFTRTLPLGAPAAPENLVATPAPAPASQINLTWSDVGGELDYALDRLENLTGTWHTVAANIPADETSFGDVGLTPGQLYSYRIRARNDAGYSAYSNVARATTPFASNERWESWSSLPLRNNLAQGITVLASQGNYLYAASNDADNADSKGTPGWFHLNVWRSTNGSVWTWVGETDQNVSGNVPVAMLSYSGNLYLLTGSRLWRSTNNGANWSQELGQGVGDGNSNGYFSHLTVFGSKLFVLLADGSIHYYDKGWFQSGATLGSVRVLAQYSNTLLAAVKPVDSQDLSVYQSSDGTTWTLLGAVPGVDVGIDGICGEFNSLFGLSSRIFSSATNTFFDACLRVSSDSASTWARTNALDIWTVLPSATEGYVVTTAPFAEFHDPMAARIDASTGIVDLLDVVGLPNSYRLWSLARHNGQNYVTAYRPSGGSTAESYILQLVDK